MSELLSDEELGGKCSVVNLLHPTGIHFKSPTCEGWFAITAHEHFRQERWESVIHGFDGTLAEHHDDPCYICDHDALTTQLAEMTKERNEMMCDATSLAESYALASARALAAEATADRYEVALEMIAEKSSYKESDHRALALTALTALTGTEPGEGT